MSQITITITIDIPEGAHVAMGGAAPQVAPVASTPPQAAREAWPAGECPKHHKPWKDGTYGPFCTAKDESTAKGYCTLKPGDVFQGRVAV